VVTVEKYHSAPHFRWKMAKKSVKFICLRPPRRYCRSARSGGGLLRKASGTPANRLLKLSKVLVTNPRDRVSEAQGRFEILGYQKFLRPQYDSSFGKGSTTRPSGSVEQGGLRPSRSGTNYCASPGGVTVTVLRDNLCCNKRLRCNRIKDITFGKLNWKRTPRTETAPSAL